MEDLIGINHPIVQGPFGGGLSTVALAAAVSDAGGLGSFGAHILEPGEITALVADLAAATAKPFAVNLWVPQPGEDIRPSPEDSPRTSNGSAPSSTSWGSRSRTLLHRSGRASRLRPRHCSLRRRR